MIKETAREKAKSWLSAIADLIKQDYYESN